MTDNADMIAYWNEVAGPKWVAGQARLDTLMAPLTLALLERAAIAPGEAVLDVGCGCGELALHCAQAAGATGDVLAVDVSAPMLAHARMRAASLVGAAPIDWIRADAGEHPFARDRDLVVSRFGVMFFADRARAFANLRRSLRPDGRIALLTWRHRAEVEWMQAPLDWLMALTPPPPSDDTHPGPFALGNAAATTAMLAAAGFRDIACESVNRSVILGAIVEDAASMLMETGPAAHLVREGSPALRVQAAAILRERLQAIATDDGVAMRAGCWIYTGRA